jgi:serine/threonine protein kinase
MGFVAPDGTELERAIGAGSVFDVAVVRAGESRLVCKRLAPPVLRAAEARAAIVREAESLAAMAHPALPRLVRVGADAHGPFVIETLVEGASLAAVVDAWASRGRAVPARLVEHVAAAAAEALAELAERADEAGPLGFVHGDLGPDHVVLGPTGEIRFVDLGAARVRGMRAAPSAAERGTLPFVAPEVARGDAAPSATADVFALAATLAFLATSAPPCVARDEGAMLVEVGERGLDLRALEARADLGRPLRAALARALAFDRAARLDTARALARALA